MSARKSKRVTVGLISDTHGLMRPEALEALRGSDLILHAGDVGGPLVLDALGRIAEVIAVRGNNDEAPWAFTLEETMRVTVGEVTIFLIHDVKTLAIEPADERIAVVISGHSHRSNVTKQSGVLWVNPGSAGPRRFRLPISVGRLIVEEGAVRAEIIPLDLPAKSPETAKKRAPTPDRPRRK